MRRADVAEQMRRLDEVVAGVQVAVVLERHRAPAGLREDAESGGDADPRRKRGVEI